MGIVGRLAPAENLPSELIAHLVDGGYQYLSTEDYTEACDMWIEAWEAIKYRCKPEPNDLDFFNRQYRGDFFVSNLCQDLERELHHAGLADSAYFEKRIDYCRGFLRLFPGADDLIIHNMRRAIAESYASLGDYQQSDAEFAKVVEDYPDNPWGYIGWGDIYFLGKKDDYDKAKELYLKALAIAKEKSDTDVVHERLEDIEHPTRPEPPEMPS
jgi:tetratricopeptide (TPR) repeat protein